jgi:hypothetical protein
MISCKGERNTLMQEFVKNCMHTMRLLLRITGSSISVDAQLMMKSTTSILFRPLPKSGPASLFCHKFQEYLKKSSHPCQMCTKKMLLKIFCKNLTSKEKRTVLLNYCRNINKDSFNQTMTKTIHMIALGHHLKRRIYLIQLKLPQMIASRV